MENIGSLSQLKVGQAAVINSVCAGGSMQRRLLDMGFTKGAVVKCLYKSPYGDPTAFMIRNAVVALRNEDAQCVFATPI